jgi:hypothetical protein
LRRDKNTKKEAGADGIKGWWPTGCVKSVAYRFRASCQIESTIGNSIAADAHDFWFLQIKVASPGSSWWCPTAGPR